MTLPEYIISKLNIPFEYGVNDCILFTIGWIEISTGKKYLPAKLWKNEKEALKLIKKNGGLEKVFDDKFKSIEPNFAQDGDLTIVEGISFLFSGSNIVSVGTNGLMTKNRILAKKAWCHG
jgi:hypothetical protein